MEEKTDWDFYRKLKEDYRKEIDKLPNITVKLNPRENKMIDEKTKQKYANIEVDKQALEMSKDIPVFVRLTKEALDRREEQFRIHQGIYGYEESPTFKAPWGKIILVSVALWAAVVGFTYYAFGEEANLVVCRGSFPYGLPRQEAVKTFEKATKKLKDELNVRIRRTSLIVKSCNLNSDWKELYWGRHFSRVVRFIPDSIEKKHRLNVAIIPGITDGPRLGMGGVASDICTESDWNAGVIAIPFINSSGFDGLDFGPLGVAHEMAHLLGCDHDETPCNSMHPDPLNQQRNCGLTRFLPQCYSEVRECRASRRNTYATSKLTK